MARMPGAVWRPMPGSSTSPITSYDITCFHTMVGSLAGTDNFFRTSRTGTNSHFGVGGDGTIWQWVDTAYRSGANLNGNWHIVSIETADMGPEFAPWSGSNVPAWTPAQIQACAAIARWAHDTHGIPLTLIPDAKIGRKGVGYHRLGVPGYMVAGAEQWSSSRGKVCPGDRRISQVPQVIATAQGEDDMPLSDDDLRKVYDAVWFGIAGARLIPNLRRDPNGTQGEWPYTTLGAMDGRIQNEILPAALAPIIAALANRPDVQVQQQPATVDPEALAAALLADDTAVQKLGDAIAAGLARRVSNG